ncbi:MAG: dipeptidase PepV [Lentihominibacter sp.]|jgi:succinyl-diaminopimelate desuccinylase
MFPEDIKFKIEENKAEMISSLSELISVASVAVENDGEEKNKAPFGEDVQKAYKMMLEAAEKEGFSCFNADNYGGHIDFKGSEDGIVGIVGHLDVVPEGEGWEFDPYGGEIIDGYVCGRGAMDDKGPVIASFYAMKALKECGFRPGKTIRLILGLDEETNWNGMKYYLEAVDEIPDCGFTPDGDFPVIHGEKGILIFDLVKKFAPCRTKGLELTSLKGGNAANSVADSARAVLHDSTGAGYETIRRMIAELRKSRGWQINCKGIGKSLEVTVRGKSAHGAKPEQGINAISIMMEFLGYLNFVSDDITDLIEFYNGHIGFDFHGERLGCRLEDEPSGRLVLNVGKINLTKDAAGITINIRYPVTSGDEEVYSGMINVLDEYGIGVIKGRHQPPIYVAADSPLISTLISIYRKHTGDEESLPLVIGGGTYARAMDNIVAFGARFPGEPELGHQKNEKISIENLVKLTEIYAEAIYELARDS